MKKKKNITGWKEIMAEVFELPKEVVMDLPRVIMAGNMQVVIENHRGIIRYDENVVRVAVNNGEIRINGEELKIRNLFAEELYIEGKIIGIENGE